MGYAIMRTGKLKTNGTSSPSKNVKDIGYAYGHNLRLEEVVNADTDRRENNIILKDSLHGLTYHECSLQTVDELRSAGVDTRTIRSDAVEGLEIMMTYSREMNGSFDVWEWAAKCMEWCEETFNPPDHKCTFVDKETGETKEIETDNVKHAILHMDEEVPHIHAFVVPIDDTGRRSVKYYQGYNRMHENQDRYAKEMEEFGLERGIENSGAFHDKKGLYSRLVDDIERKLPEREFNETIYDYGERMNDFYISAAEEHSILMEQIASEAHIVELKSQSYGNERVPVLSNTIGDKDISDIKSKEIIPEPLVDETQQMYNKLVLWQFNEEQKEQEKVSQYIVER